MAAADEPVTKTSVGIYIACHGRFSSKPKLISPPEGVCITKHNRSGFGCVAYIRFDMYEINVEPVETYDVALKLATNTFKMSSHDAYTKAHKANEYYKKDFEPEHIRIPGEICTSSDSPTYWKITNYKPYREAEFINNNAFQIYVSDDRKINLWNCTNDEAIRFLGIDTEDTKQIIIQKYLLDSLKHGEINTEDLFGIMYVLKTQGHTNFNIADYACHAQRDHEQRDISPDTLSKTRHDALYGGHKTRRNKRLKKKKTKKTYIVK